MTSATRGVKLGRELAVGDALIVFDAPQIITSIEEADGFATRLVRTTGDGAFLIHALEEHVVEEAAPGPYDGYMSEVEGGRWHVTSGGVDLGTFEDESVAATTLAATSKRPTWKVTLTGTVTRLG